MATKVSISTLNASTMDILNVIRANASAEYLDNVPEVLTATDIPKVGEVFAGYPALANQFISSLMNRIAMVQLKSATFNNPYSRLKKGYLAFGETIEEIFVSIIKARTFDVEKAASREFKRTLPDVQTAFHIMNWRVQYPITIQDEDLTTAFLSADGVTNLISKIIEQVYTAAEYDEFLLFKYLIIKGVASGKFKPVSIGTGADMTVAAKKFRGTSNQITFMSKYYNEKGVMNNTPRTRQIIFMDSQYNADFDVDVLSAAFNMEKADFMGSLFLIDSFSTFDNERFEDIRTESDMIEEVTSAELALMAGVKAVLVDEDWFQVYDNRNKMTEVYVSSGMYWNYNYNVWKTISSSPFHNAIAMVTDAKMPTLPATIDVKVTAKTTSAEATVITLTPQMGAVTLINTPSFVQTEDAVTNLVAVHPYGAYIFPTSAVAATVTLTVDAYGTLYTAAAELATTVTVGDTITLTKVV